MGESWEGSAAAMEMLEEGQNQPKIAAKQMGSQELVDEGDEDRISTLLECLLLEILSRLPATKYAIRTGTLSKRWKHLWTWVPTLVFIDQNHPWLDFLSFVSKTLTQCRPVKLKKFVLSTNYNDTRSKLKLNSIIRYALSCNVEELNLQLWNVGNNIVLDQFFFINTCVTDLTLSWCELNPTGAISWKNLRSLCIYYVKLDEDLIENILSGSPVLETLLLEYCYGYRRLNITSKSVKKLVISGYTYTEVGNNIIEIKAPNILSLTIQGDLWWKLLLLNKSSVVKANLDYANMGHWETISKEEEEEMLKGLILNLRHVKGLKIGSRCSEVLSRLEAKGFVFPSNVKFSDGFYK